MNVKKLLIIILAVTAVSLFFVFDLGRYLTLHSLKEHRELLVRIYLEHRLLTIAAFMAVYILQTALSLPGAAVLSLAAGAIFGTVQGMMWTTIAATIGATLAFLAARYLLRDLLGRRFGSRMQRLNRELDTRGLGYLLFLRLVPAFPFFLVNLASGLTSLPLRTFFFGTFVGIIPGSFVFCNAGASLATVRSMNEIASPRVLGSLALLGLFALVPALHAWAKKPRGPARQDSP